MRTPATWQSVYRAMVAAEEAEGERRGQGIKGMPRPGLGALIDRSRARALN